MSTGNDVHVHAKPESVAAAACCVIPPWRNDTVGKVEASFSLASEYTASCVALSTTARVIVELVPRQSVATPSSLEMRMIASSALV